jgi:hypothetical protein
MLLISNEANKDTNLKNKETTKIYNFRQGDRKIPKVFLGDTLINPPQNEPFFTKMLINNKLVRNFMIDLGATINIMPMGVMK